MACRAALGALGVVALLGGCGPAVEAIPGGSSAGGSSSGWHPTSSGVVDDSVGGTSGAGTTSSPPPTPPVESSTTNTGLETSTGELNDCHDFPPRDYLRLVPEELPRDVIVSLVDALCLVESSEVDGTLLTYRLQCDQGQDEPVPHALDVYSHDGQARPLLEAEMVRLRTYRTYPIDYGLISVTLLTTPEGELLGGDYPWPPPYVPDEVAAWFEVSVEMVDIGCATVDPSPPATGFILDPCPSSSTVIGANVVWGENTVTLQPGVRAEVGELLFSGSFQDHDYPDDGCYEDGLRGGVAFYRQRR